MIIILTKEGEEERYIFDVRSLFIFSNQSVLLRRSQDSIHFEILDLQAEDWDSLMIEKQV